MEAADVVLVSSDVCDVVAALHLSRKVSASTWRVIPGVLRAWLARGESDGLEKQCLANGTIPNVRVVNGETKEDLRFQIVGKRYARTEVSRQGIMLLRGCEIYLGSGFAAQFSKLCADPSARGSCSEISKEDVATRGVMKLKPSDVAIDLLVI